MGIIFSFLPSVSRNTMCCVNVTTRRACWEKEPTVQMHCASYYHTTTAPPKKKVVKDDTPANEVEYDATIDVYAPVDTDRMLAEAHYDQIMKDVGMKIN